MAEEEEEEENGKENSFKSATISVRYCVQAVVLGDIGNYSFMSIRCRFITCTLRAASRLKDAVFYWPSGDLSEAQL